MLKRYKSIFNEAFRSKDTQKALQLTANVISRRLGKPIQIGELTYSFSNSDGDYSAVVGIVGSKEAIRFNWLANGSSSTIESISYWYSPKETPDITIDTNGMNIIKIIDTIVEAIQTGNIQDYQVFTEKVSAASGGKVSQAIADSINQWREDTDLGEYDLENRRMSELYQQYTFWYNNLSDDIVDSVRFVPKPTFLKYMQDALNRLGITNKFARKVKVRKASKEIQKVNKVDEKQFKTAILEMSLEDKMDMIAMATDAVIKGYKTSLLVTGTAGIGKTKTVKEQLQDKGQAYKYFSGGIKNARALYQVLYDNNDKNLVLVFDDVNNILRNKEAIELLRVATTNDKKREITYTDNVIKAGNRKYKPQMIFESRIIIITNIPKKKLDKAIVSRTAALEIIVNPQEIADNIRINLEGAPPPNMPIEWKMEVWEFLSDEIGFSNMKQLDYRIFEMACIWRASSEGSPAWKKFVYAQL